MAVPINEQIAVKVKTRLEAITTGNGYEITVPGVSRPERIDELNPVNYQIKVTQEAETPNEELSCQGNPPAQAWDMPFKLACLIKDTEAIATPIDTLRNKFRADVVKAIGIGTAWWNWDSLAIDSRFSNCEPITEGDGSIAGVHLTLTVTYRTDENNPYNVR